MQACSSTLPSANIPRKAQGDLTRTASPKLHDELTLFWPSWRAIPETANDAR